MVAVMNDVARTLAPLTILVGLLGAACGDDAGGGTGGGRDGSSGTETVSVSSGDASSGDASSGEGTGTGADAAGTGAGSSSSATQSGGTGGGSSSSSGTQSSGTSDSSASSGTGGAASSSASSGGGGHAERVGLLVETPAEGSDWHPGWDTDSQTADNGYALEQSSERARVGESAIRFELRDTDPIVSSSVRTEMTRVGDEDAEEMERWYGLSYFLTDWESDDGGESIIQWHDVDGTCPPLSLQIYANQIQLTSCIDFGNTYFPIGDVVSNEWMDIVIHVVWRTDDSGVLELWRNGEKVVDAHDLRTQSTGGSYLKVGMNKWSWAPDGGQSNVSRRVFFIDEVRIGDETSNLESVSPGDW